VIGWFEAAVLGLVQGLTEFLPISSSAHLRIVAELFGWEDPGAAFTAVSQIGTEAAVLLYFRRDIARILRSWALSLWRPELRGDFDARMGWYVLLGTLPIGVLGLLLESRIESVFRSLWLVAATLVGFGIVLGVADRVARNRKPVTSLTLRDALLFGSAQALALIPGVSRSGGTISMGLLLGYTREASARYAFLLAIPAVLASGIYKLKDVGGDAGTPAWGPTILATAIAFAVGYAAIALLLRYISTRSFMPFVIYRVLLGGLVLVLLGAGVIDATA
jgi:undecaprenyl-diphosphatase